VLHELGATVLEQHQEPDRQRTGRRGRSRRQADPSVPRSLVPNLDRLRQPSGGHHRVQVGIPAAIPAVCRLRAAGRPGVLAAVARPTAHGRQQGEGQAPRYARRGRDAQGQRAGRRILAEVPGHGQQYSGRLVRRTAQVHARVFYVWPQEYYVRGTYLTYIHIIYM